MNEVLGISFNHPGRASVVRAPAQLFAALCWATIALTADIAGMSLKGDPSYVGAFRSRYTAATATRRLGVHAASIGGKTPPAPTAFAS